MSFLFFVALMNLSLAQDSEEGDDSGGLYVAFDWGIKPDSQAFRPKLDFAINEDTTGHFSTNPQRPHSNSGVGMGLRLRGDRLSIRYQGGWEWINVDFGNLVYDDSALDHSVEGALEMSGPSGGLFFDLRLGDSGNFLYLGSSLGYVKTRNSYRFIGDGRTVDWEDTDWTQTTSFESGAIFKLKSGTGLTLAYKFTRADGLRYKTSLDNDLKFSLGGLHGFKVGIVHFFRRK